MTAEEESLLRFRTQMGVCAWKAWGEYATQSMVDEGALCLADLSDEAQEAVVRWYQKLIPADVIIANFDRLATPSIASLDRLLSLPDTRMATPPS